jgi:hypothetical protein
VALFRVVAWLLRFELVLEGAEHLPRTSDGRAAGGWIAAGLPHRTWIEPFVLVLLLPLEPRLTFLGDGRAIFRLPLRRLALRLVGGVVPIWPGGRRDAFEAHADAAESVTRAGAVFALFPEVGPPVPAGVARPLGVVLGGTHELYRGRRIVLRVLPPVGGRKLAGQHDGDELPAGSPAEREAAHRVVAALHALTAASVAETHAAAEPEPGTRKRWRWLTGLIH